MADLTYNGIIMKGIGGFYHVKTADSVLECKAKGIFRKRGVTPLAGDRVEVIGEEGGYAISEILERKNFFQRPPIANVDEFFYVVSSVEPRPNYMVADRLIMLCRAAARCAHRGGRGGKSRRKISVGRKMGGDRRAGRL